MDMLNKKIIKKIEKWVECLKKTNIIRWFPELDYLILITNLEILLINPLIRKYFKILRIIFPNQIQIIIGQKDTTPKELKWLIND